MIKFNEVFCFFVLLTLPLLVHAKQTTVNSLRYQIADDRTGIIFDVNRAIPHRITSYKNPHRLAIDFYTTKLLKPLTQPPVNHALLRGVRSAIRDKNNLRVVVDLKKAVKYKSFSLKPSKRYGHRLVINLLNTKNTGAALNTKPSKKAKRIIKTVKNKLRKIVVAIDAGHGGKDPGASGAKGTQEKRVTLQIAKRVAALINKKPGMKAVLVRKGDYYIKLRKRMAIARAAKADLFVSIHADAYKNAKVKGASVFTLSNRSASSEAARWLAQHENAADLIGGVKLADKEDVLASVLMDLSQTATKEASRQVAFKVLNNFKDIGHLHKDEVQKANFIVLKSPDIPSILIETAFISNPLEERKLKSKSHQIKMAKAISQGISSYFIQYAPADTYLAANAPQEHTIMRGETLSGIATYYGVTMRSIKLLNQLLNSRIHTGQVLTIPKG